MDKEHYEFFIEELTKFLITEDSIDFEMYFYEQSIWEIKSGDLHEEDLGPLYPMLSDWFYFHLGEYKHEVLFNFNIISGKIYLENLNPTISIEFRGPFDGEFEDFYKKNTFQFSETWLTSVLNLKITDDFGRIVDFHGHKVFIECFIENYQLNEQDHFFDFDLFYLDTNRVKHFLLLSDSQKYIVRNHIINDVLRDLLPSLTVPSECVQTFESIYIQEDVDANYISLGEVTTSAHIILLSEIERQRSSPEYRYFK